MSFDVINLGLPKTGTTTLAKALRRGGFRVADHRIRPRQTDVVEMHGVYVADLLYRGYFETGDPAAHFGKFNAVTELSLLREGKTLWPQMDFGLIEAIRKNNPNVKFLGSRRDSWKTSQSMLGWSDLGMDRLPSSDVPGLPKGYGETSKERTQWIDAHYDFLDRVFAGDPAYLTFDVADEGAQASVGAHIGVTLPWWGHANSNKKTKAG